MRSLAGTLAALCLTLAAIASAQTYPEKQVTVVIPFPPGGAVDPIARTVTQHMSEQWSQPIVLLNRAGAGGNAVTDVLGGHVEMTFVPIPAALPLVQAGKLRALGVSTARRSSALPEVPTIAEAGVAGYEAGSWTALLAPAATPRPIINRIHAAATGSLRSPGVKEVLSKTGAEPVGNTPDEFSQILREETVKWGKVIQAAGGTLE